MKKLETVILAQEMMTHVGELGEGMKDTLYVNVKIPLSAYHEPPPPFTPPGPFLIDESQPTWDGTNLEDLSAEDQAAWAARLRWINQYVLGFVPNPLDPEQLEDAPIDCIGGTFNSGDIASYPLCAVFFRGEDVILQFSSYVSDGRGWRFALSLASRIVKARRTGIQVGVCYSDEDFYSENWRGPFYTPSWMKE
ncbi:MAG: hypothetical protein UU48_C0001G0072 [Candidatus Uhrbacteria bacterium GW2011_GWF2_41_16]|uniref:Uncharacterized protein n=2 Tax=Candidatus Uhriibacteriota TaxID=1752732 RepID=A0A0G0YEH2_9BACT|nr:MAG: hypothetical protein UU31_C0002G0116 [Candidatus Uhrbacteria bacterium GW2011_GWA2_41_10]KKR87778.1 MAG: hypothetical protein UU35_C0001G0059 [Candidatus Uhrbacteria bacterium GW2011_GWC2_41_11]KKR98717.1 MAG: hypothetical protein UU48_C0001G0072 [Candidatus Uhrbacteria bacterium GW2011_GWF2_41_16]HBP00186.1 hypothetical protein [Candidatus Uhrbacteria bacterium]